MKSSELRPEQENPTYLQAEKNLEDRLAAQAVTTVDGQAVILAGDVKIQGIVRHSKFTQRVCDGPNGDSCERLDFAIAPTTDLRAVSQGQLREKVNEVVKGAFDAVTLPNGKKLSEMGFDFSGKVSTDEKPFKEQVGDLKKLVNAGIAEAQEKLPAEVVNLLQHGKTFETDSTVFGFNAGVPDVRHGHVEVSLVISSKNEGAKTNSALVQENIEARKEELLAAMREATIANLTANNAKPEEIEKFKTDLASLDLKTELTQTGVKLRIGNKSDEKDKAGEPTVGKTMLAALSEKNLEQIVSDTLLFKGKGAADVAHLIAGDSDIRRLLTEYQDKSPKFAEALKTEVMTQSVPWEEYSKAEADKKAAQPIKPEVNIDTSFNNGRQNNEIHVAIDLPKGVMQKAVIAGLAGKPLVQEVVGKMTQNLADGRAAANEGQAKIAM